MSAFNRPQLGSLICQSLLRNAPIALTLHPDLPAAEVASISRLRELIIPYGNSATANIVLPLLALAALQGLQTLRLSCRLSLSTLQLLPRLPALRTLDCWLPAAEDSEDWSWLPAMPALTDLDYTGQVFCPLPQSLLDAIGRCASLRALRLRDPRFEAGSFARFCSTPAMRQLRQLELCFQIDSWKPADVLHSDECCAAFSALAGLETLRLRKVAGLDRLLPHLAHAPALRTLIIPCAMDVPRTLEPGGSTHPGHDALRQLLDATSRLQVRLDMAVTIDEWRSSCWYEQYSVPQREEIDCQWHELQRVVDLERVTIDSQ